MLLLPYGVRIEPVDGFHDVKHDKGLVYICTGQISSGFVWPSEPISIITDNEIFGRKLRPKRVPKEKIGPQTIAFEDLKKGELVVHIEHGIGRYEGLIKLKLNGSNNDFLLINYKNSDKLYLPVDRMSMVQKYMGVDGMVPVLDRLGGKSWERVKQRVKFSAKYFIICNDGNRFRRPDKPGRDPTCAYVNTALFVFNILKSINRL